MTASRPSPAVHRRSTTPLVVVLAALALLVAACSSDSSRSSGADRSTTTAISADGATTTTAAGGSTGDGGLGGTDVPTDDPADGHECDQGATTDEVATTPVTGVASDLDLTSFDGTQIRMHWFPLDGAGPDDPAPTVLMGPGWSLSGDTSLGDDPAPFGLLSIKDLHDEGYSVLTWDPRGFGKSGGQAEVDAPDVEGRDVQTMIDWVAEQPQAMLDATGDPRVGMVGGSYGGGIQLTTAAIDCRVDAIVPNMAWHSLETSLFQNETVKEGWASILTDIGGAHVDPHIGSAYESGITTGTLSADDKAWFIARGPGDLVDQITTPTLLIQGTVDTLFPLDEATAVYRSLRDRKVPVAMDWYCGGHGACLVDPGDTDLPGNATTAWLARYLRADPSVDTGARFRTVDQDGGQWEAADLPAADDHLTGTGKGTLALTAESTTGPIPLGDSRSGLLDGLVKDITPGPATGPKVEVTVDAGDTDALALGAPTLTLSYSGTTPDGAKPTRVFAQLVDPERGVVVGNQVTPVPLVLDGSPQTLEVDLETVAQRIQPGTTLVLQLVATTPAYAEPRLGGQVTFDRIDVDLPIVTSMAPAGGGDVR